MSEVGIAFHEEKNRIDEEDKILNEVSYGGENVGLVENAEFAGARIGVGEGNEENYERKDCDTGDD